MLLIITHAFGVICYILWVDHVRRGWSKGWGKGDVISYVFPLILLFKYKGRATPFRLSLFAIYLYLLLMNSLIMISTGYSPTVYTILMAYILIYELSLIFSYTYIFLAKKTFLISIYSVLVAVILAGVVMNFIHKTYEPLDIIDFLMLLVKISSSILAISVIPKDGIEKHIELIFILLGFFILQLFDSINSYLMLKNIHDYWELGLVPIMIVFTFWGSSQLWIRNFRYKLSG